MRKPRDLQAELSALSQRAKALKARRVLQLGELVIAAGADNLSPEILAGALLAAAGEHRAAVTDAWRLQGERFFRGPGQPAENHGVPSGQGRGDAGQG